MSYRMAGMVAVVLVLWGLLSSHAVLRSIGALLVLLVAQVKDALIQMPDFFVIAMNPAAFGDSFQ